MDVIKNNMRKNLISKKTGMGDHMIADKVTDIIFKNQPKYIDTINTDNELGQCIKNQYVTIDWIKNIIGNPHWANVGKEKALYEYFVDDGDLNKPNLKNTENEDEDILYLRASGDMQFDFDDLTDEQIEDIRKSFIICCKKSSYHWFEYSWSHSKQHDLSGCHVRVYAKLSMKTKLEWGFWYIHLLNGILKHVSNKNRDEIIKHIDWSCCSVTRGFAIPYNKGGVLMNNNYNEDDIISIENEDILDKLFHELSCEWFDELYEYFIKKFVKPKKRKELEKLGLLNENEGFKYRYSMEEEWLIDDNHKKVDGSIYNYNWRLSLVTTLMGVFNKDKEYVRKICAVIYKFIKPYKNHTYEEMLNDELERKIFNRANFELEPSHEILKELWNNWGLKITIRPNIN